MALRKILVQGDPALEKRCRPVEKFDQRLYILLDDLRETLTDANGAGLAAPQVGILRRAVIVLDENEEMMELINPVLVSTEGEEQDWEGCLSVPGMYGQVKRPAKATVRAQDRSGAFFEVTGEGLVARCLCHELEHLDGHLYVDRVIGQLYTAEEVEAMEEKKNGQQEKRKGKKEKKA